MREFLQSLSQQTPRMAQTLFSIGEYYDNMAFKNKQLALEERKTAASEKESEANIAYLSEQTSGEKIDNELKEKTLPYEVDLRRITAETALLAKESAQDAMNFNKDTYQARVDKAYAELKQIEASIASDMANARSSDAQTMLYGQQYKAAGLGMLINTMSFSTSMVANPKDANALTLIVNNNMNEDGTYNIPKIVREAAQVGIKFASPEKQKQSIELENMVTNYMMSADAVRQQTVDARLNSDIEEYRKKHKGQFPSDQWVADNKANYNKILKRTMPDNSIYDSILKNNFGTTIRPNLGIDGITVPQLTINKGTDGFSVVKPIEEYSIYAPYGSDTTKMSIPTSAIPPTTF
jgi:hypothetical protein